MSLGLVGCRSDDSTLEPESDLMPETTLEVASMSFEKEKMSKYLDELGYVIAQNEYVSESDSYWQYTSDKSVPLFLGSEVDGVLAFSSLENEEVFEGVFLTLVGTESKKETGISNQLDDKLGKGYITTIENDGGDYKQGFWKFKERILLISFEQNEDIINSVLITELNVMEERFVELFGHEEWENLQGTPAKNIEEPEEVTSTANTEEDVVKELESVPEDEGIADTPLGVAIGCLDLYYVSTQHSANGKVDKITYQVYPCPNTPYLMEEFNELLDDENQITSDEIYYDPEIVGEKLQTIPDLEKVTKDIKDQLRKEGKYVEMEEK